MVGMDRFNLTANIACWKQLPLVYTRNGCVWHSGSPVYLCARVGPCPLCVWRILTVYWQDVDYPACGRMRPVWPSGGSHSAEEWWDNHTEKERERGGHMSGQRTMTISCQSQLTWTQHYQDPIIYSNALKWDTHRQTHMLGTYCTCTSDWCPLAKPPLKTLMLGGSGICQIWWSCGEYFFTERRAKNSTEGLYQWESCVFFFSSPDWLEAFDLPNFAGSALIYLIWFIKFGP